MIWRVISMLHRVFGLLLSVMFLLWFLSGFVMIFHTFPRASQEYRVQRQQPLQGDALPPLGTLLAAVPDSVRLESLTLEMRFDRPVVALRGNGYAAECYADSGEAVEPFDDRVLQQTAHLWCDAPVRRIDTLRHVDQWVPFESMQRELPIYRYHFDDAERHQLYLSSRDGRALQFTDRNSRFWAWLGPIPHWVYFTLLRQHQTLWIETVKWMAGIGCLMCFAGWLVALYRWWRQRDKGFWRSPYKKRWFKWHFVSGIFFGLFAITFAFSGLMSLIDLPDWMRKAPRETVRQTERPRRGGEREGGLAPLGSYRLDYRVLLAGTDSVKSLSFGSWDGHPYYKLSGNRDTRYVDAADSASVRPFRLTEAMIRERMQRQFPDTPWRLELLTEYDRDYYARKPERAPLPVYRVSVEDYLHTHLYIHPETLAQRRVDDDARTRRFLFSGLHSLNIKFLTDRPVLWYIVMFTLLAGGTVLSLSGVVLTLQWIRRKVRSLLTQSSN